MSLIEQQPLRFLSDLTDRELQQVLRHEREHARFGGTNYVRQVERELDRRMMRGLRMVRHLRVGEA